MEDKFCEQCGVLIPRGSMKPYHYRKRRFCSTVCAGLWGKVHTPVKTHCKNGHPNIPENRYRSNCRLCLEMYRERYSKDGRLKRYHQRDRDEVTRRYVASMMHIPVAELSDEVYEARRFSVLKGRERKRAIEAGEYVHTCAVCGKEVSPAPSDWYTDQSGVVRYHVRQICSTCSWGGRKNYLRHRVMKCEMCGFEAVHRRQMDVHHIDLDKGNNDPGNLMTLCANCHRLVHALLHDKSKKDGRIRPF